MTTSGESVEDTMEKPPTNYEEFLKAEGLNDWPFKMSLEGPLDIESEGLFMGTQEHIAELLRTAAPVGLQMLDEMETRLDELDNVLYMYANEILTDDKRVSRIAEGLFHSPSSTFITEGMEHLISRRNSKAVKSYDLMDSMLESKKRSLDNLKFPGFSQGELIELPSQLEVPPILHRVTTAQGFNPGFEKFWKKLFLSEASSVILQDMFWWVFLDMFSKEDNQEEVKDSLFDRVADSYVALFTSINVEVKDKFLSVYPNCLAQAIYCVFKDAFPESQQRFNDDFKKYLVTLIFELVTGLRPVPGIWKTWNDEGLEQKTIKETEKAKMLQAAGLHQKVNLSLDMEGFNKTIDKLGTELIQPVQTSRETTKTSQVKGKTIQRESHQVGPGPDFERVTFNTSGRSPLIAHYLHMRHLRNYKQPGMKVRRTEIVKLPPEGPTYEQLITSTINKANASKKQYERTSEQTEAEILELHKKQRDINRRINAMKRAFNSVKTVQERQLLIDKFTEEMNLKEVLIDKLQKDDEQLSDGHEEEN
ncbi:protein FAM227B-like isoform X1 [Biomphalaria glabrata]|uniref:Protein FAM227B-like isoform X1 n=3 Tax=Biomphalaria glabrata TaxID=6526 RepID=A0A9W2ZHB3_BIOGL|nr:protein FAM227B-like isoform X1 [Biomphalaria glabrata]XP_055874343.1 protein FAM227B-like isoform X1 [Biomphalaria glabrata]XP_055874344.1 protein FAM227B-like isoform X1 [Biomphalaria glabrata]